MRWLNFFGYNILPDIYYYHFCPPGVPDLILEHDTRFDTTFNLYYWKDYYYPENRWHSLVANWFDVTLAGV